jgi:predicted secreted protein
MSLVGQIVVFSIIWMVVLFTILPIKIKSQIENKNISLGTDPGAPSDPHIMKKFLITTIVSLIIFAIINLLTYFQIINLRDFFSKQ